MTTTAPPPESHGEPGVDRRHTLADFYHERTNFQIIRGSRRWLILSTAFMVLSVLFLVVRGLNLGIEFEGGTQWQVAMADGRDASVADVRDLLDPLDYSDAKITVLTSGGDESVRVQSEVIEDPVRTIAKRLARFGAVDEAQVEFVQTGEGGTFTLATAESVTPTKDAVTREVEAAGATEAEVTVADREVTVKLDEIPESDVQRVGAALAEYAGVETQDVSITTVGPTWGEELSRKAVQALIVFFILLAVYLSIRFEWKMAFASIVTVLHDIMFTVGFYAAFQFPVTPATVTSALTILGFSLYDTIVVFDKVAEYEKSLIATGRSTYAEMVNRALNAVLMRSLSTSLVALLPVMSLIIIGSMIMGATTLQDFALALAVGLFIGSYSSIFIAAPLLAWWKEREPQYRALKDRRRRTTAAAAAVATGAPAVRGKAAEPAASDEWETVGVPGPPAVPRAPIQARPRQQRGRKRR
jgi:preprotein translocase subunit SecF